MGELKGRPEVPRSATLVTVLVLVGFPLALVLSWMFDVTPQGVEWTGKAGDAAAELRRRRT